MFYFFTGHTKFLQQRQSLAVSAVVRSISRNSVVVSTACARSRGPTRGCRARFRGRATRVRARRRCTIVRRDTCQVANADNAHLTTSNSILCSVLCALRMCDYALMLVDAYYAQNCAGIMYASLPLSHCICRHHNAVATMTPTYRGRVYTKQSREDGNNLSILHKAFHSIYVFSTVQFGCLGTINTNQSIELAAWLWQKYQLTGCFNTACM